MVLAMSKGISLLIIVSNIILFVCASCHKISCPPPPSPIPKPKCPPPPSSIPKPKCPENTLKFGVCGSWLGLVREEIGTKPSPECCSLVKGIADIEAAVCICIALKANVLGIVKLDLPIALNLLLNGCGKNIPQGFKC